MKYRITAPRRLEGTMCLPASKSISNRALILQALAQGALTELSNLSDCDDTFVMLRALEHPHLLEVDIKAAGTAMRFLTAYYAVTPGERTLTGTERMRQRPIGVLVDALRSLGADIGYCGNEGFPPLHIRGRRLGGKSLKLPASVSSQYVSALLMIAPLLPEGLDLELEGTVVSRPYIDLTLDMMRAFGAKARWVDGGVPVPGGEGGQLRVEPGPYRPTEYTVENDWSAASYAYEMLALAPEGGSLFLPHLYPKSSQGDSCVAELFAPLGIRTEYLAEGVRLTRTEPSLAPGETYEVDFLRCPDLAQTLVVTCPLLGVPFRFCGLQSLKIKETDRIAALRAEMRKLGFVIGEEADTPQGTVLYWSPEQDKATDASRQLPEAPIATYEDHRMAMSFAPAALRLPQVEIENPGVVSKSFPSYWDVLRRASFSVEELD
ncbi:MAG: 3-phosphoshikimate 1-carboxyvinyltransferase [Bacteroidaceae bacterium]|jgi:3-phosphoshikimate 1-carboxyvinyltransferase